MSGSKYTVRMIAAIATMVGAMSNVAMAEPEMRLSGACPGMVTVEVTNATPFADIALVRSGSLGSTLVPVAPCMGLPLDLANPALLTILHANSAGHATFSGNAPSGACGILLDAIDLDSCGPSNIVELTSLGTCTENMDSSCPDAAPQCGANFAGGESCVIDGLGNCYDTGAFSFAVDPGSSASVTFDDAVNALEIFFASTDSSTGGFEFFDENGDSVDTLFTNGECVLTMPDRQLVVFRRPVYSATIVAGATRVYVDSMTINP